jgi:hypothetical protein
MRDKLWVPRAKRQLARVRVGENSNMQAIDTEKLHHIKKRQ